MPAGMLGFTIRQFTTNLPVNPKTQLQAVCSIVGFARAGNMDFAEMGVVG